VKGWREVHEEIEKEKEREIGHKRDWERNRVREDGNQRKKYQSLTTNNNFEVGWRRVE
jgi:hypothetical protein